MVEPGRPSTVVTPTPNVPSVANEIAVGDEEPNGHVPLHTLSIQLGARDAVVSVVNAQKVSVFSPTPHSELEVIGLSVAAEMGVG